MEFYFIIVELRDTLCYSCLLYTSDAPNRAELVNNYDWMKNFTFLDFAREVGKHITCLLYTSS